MSLLRRTIGNCKVFSGYREFCKFYRQPYKPFYRHESIDDWQPISDESELQLIENVLDGFDGIWSTDMTKVKRSPMIDAPQTFFSVINHNGYTPPGYAPELVIVPGSIVVHSQYNAPSLNFLKSLLPEDEETIWEFLFSESLWIDGTFWKSHLSLDGDTFVGAIHPFRNGIIDDQAQVTFQFEIKWELS